MSTNLVVKSNVLNEAPIYKKSSELKIFDKIILLVREDPKKDIYTFQIKELMKELNITSSNYQYIKQVAKNMMIAEFGDGKKNIILEVIFRRVDITEAGTISFKIDSEFKPFVVDLSKNFTKYYFENIANLKSSFSIHLYRFMKQWQKIGNRKIGISALRSEILKIDENKYKTYNNFKRKIILVAQKELEEKTDIKFDFEEIKTGRRITDIHFFIKPNYKKTIEAQETKKALEITPSIKKLFEALKIPLKTQEKLFSSYSEERLLNNLRYTKKELEKGKIKSNTTAFLISALKKDYANQTNLFSSKEHQKEKQKKQDEKKQELEKIKADFEESRDKKVFDYISENKEDLGKDFAEFINFSKVHFDKLNIKSDDFEEQKIRDLINTDNQTKMYFRFFIMKKIMKKSEYDFEEFLKTQK